MTAPAESGGDTGAGVDVATSNVLLRRLARHNSAFLWVVVLPTLVAAAYYAFIASNIYLSESTFLVRNEQQRSTSRLDSVLSSVGVPESNETTVAIEAYMQSRDALTVLDHELGIRSVFGDGGVDPLSRFGLLPWRRGFEHFLPYYLDRIVEFSPTQSPNVVTLAVRAFDPELAYRINQRLLELAEQKINALNADLLRQSERYARTDLDEANENARAAALALAQYRAGRAVMDPNRESAIPLDVIGKLEAEVAATRNLIAVVANVAPNNPQLPVLRRKVADLEAQVGVEHGAVAGRGPRSMAALAENYDRLALAQNTASKVLALATEAYTEARTVARRKQIFFERVAQPSHPDAAIEPSKVSNVFATFLLSLVLWGVLKLLIAAIREHSH